MDHRAVLITGTSSGIGAASALLLAAKGLRVYAGIRRVEDGQRLVRQAHGSLMPLIVDVTQPDTLHAARTQLESELGADGLGALVCNAGIVVPGPLELLSPEDLARQFGVNVLGTHASIQTFLPLLRAAYGRIVIMGSISGWVTPPHFGAYAATKHALEAFADALRMELRAARIAVSIIEPDAVATPLWGKFDRDTAADRPAIAPALSAYYEADLERLRIAGARMAKSGAAVAKVAAAVEHAVCAARPKARYRIGWRTRLAQWAAGCLPSPLLDWALRKSVGLS